MLRLRCSYLVSHATLDTSQILQRKIFTSFHYKSWYPPLRGRETSLLVDCQCHRCAGMECWNIIQVAFNLEILHSNELQESSLYAYIDEPNLSAFLKLPALSVLQVVYPLAVKVLDFRITWQIWCLNLSPGFQVGESLGTTSQLLPKKGDH